MKHIFLKPRIIRKEKRKIDGKWIWIEEDITDLI